MASYTGPPCPWCRCTEWSVEKEDIIEGKVFTSYDPNNGPVYFARCERCCAQGPIVSLAADAIPVLSIKTLEEFLTFSKENDALRPDDP